MFRTSYPHPGFSDKGTRQWPVLEFCAENLDMRMQWCKHNPRTLSEKCDGVSLRYINKILTGERDNPSMEVLSALQTELRCFFVIF